MSETDTVDVEALAAARSMEDLVARALGYMRSTVHFEESQKDYGSGPSFSATFQFLYDPDADEDEWLDKARRAADCVKSAVWEQMGVEARRNDDGILMRVATSDVMNAFPGTTVVNEPDQYAAAHAVEPSQAVGPNPPYFDSKFKPGASDLPHKDMYAANREWAQKRYATHPQEFEDQRPRKASGEAPNGAPDMKHKRHWRSGFYLDKN